MAYIVFNILMCLQATTGLLVAWPSVCFLASNSDPVLRVEHHGPALRLDKKLLSTSFAIKNSSVVALDGEDYSLNLRDRELVASSGVIVLPVLCTDRSSIRGWRLLSARATQVFGLDGRREILVSHDEGAAFGVWSSNDTGEFMALFKDASAEGMSLLVSGERGVTVYSLGGLVLKMQAHLDTESILVNVSGIGIVAVDRIRESKYILYPDKTDSVLWFGAYQDHILISSRTEDGFAKIELYGFGAEGDLVLRNEVLSELVVTHADQNEEWAVFLVNGTGYLLTNIHTGHVYLADSRRGNEYGLHLLGVEVDEDGLRAKIVRFKDGSSPNTYDIEFQEY